MSVRSRLNEFRRWFPTPVPYGGLRPGRWLLLDGNRRAVTLFLLGLVFTSIFLIGTLWTFEMRQLLTETDAVQTVLNTFMSGIILLVSIVVSISAIVLSYQITSVGAQKERIEEVMHLRERVGKLAEGDTPPRNPSAFLVSMAEVIDERAERLGTMVQQENGEFADAVREYVDGVSETVEKTEQTAQQIGGAEYGVLWEGLDLDYGQYMDRSNQLRTTFDQRHSEEVTEQFEELLDAFELFSTGQEYFKTIYYTREISDLSRTLLVVSLPAIIITGSTILAIDARLLPNVWVFGLPPLLTFVSIAFTISLAPYVVLTAYMLRVATVAYRTTSAGPFVLEP